MNIVDRLLPWRCSHATTETKRHDLGYQLRAVPGGVHIQDGKWVVRTCVDCGANVERPVKEILRACYIPRDEIESYPPDAETIRAHLEREVWAWNGVEEDGE